LLAVAIARALAAAGCAGATAAHSSEQGRRAFASGRYDVVMWVADRLDAAAIGRAERLRGLRPGSALCVVGRVGDPVALRALLEADRGPVAVVLRGPALDAAELTGIIRQLLAGRCVVDHGLLTGMLERPVAVPVVSPLSDGERETLELLAAGLRNRVIAEKLWKSEKAVEKRVTQLFAKLGLPPERDLDRRVIAARMVLCQRTRFTDSRG
jgi:DNA-binding NarL/FixJ family response regulator